MGHRRPHRGQVDLSPRDVSSHPPCTLSHACPVCTDLFPSTHSIFPSHVWSSSPRCLVVGRMIRTLPTTCSTDVDRWRHALGFVSCGSWMDRGSKPPIVSSLSFYSSGLDPGRDGLKRKGTGEVWKCTQARRLRRCGEAPHVLGRNLREARGHGKRNQGAGDTKDGRKESNTQAVVGRTSGHGRVQDLQESWFDIGTEATHSHNRRSKRWKSPVRSTKCLRVE